RFWTNPDASGSKLSTLISPMSRVCAGTSYKLIDPARVEPLSSNYILSEHHPAFGTEPGEAAPPAPRAHAESPWHALRHRPPPAGDTASCDPSPPRMRQTRGSRGSVVPHCAGTRRSARPRPSVTAARWRASRQVAHAPRQDPEATCPQVPPRPPAP